MRARRGRRCCVTCFAAMVFFLVAHHTLTSFNEYLEQDFWDTGDFVTASGCSEASFNMNGEYVPQRDELRDMEHYYSCRLAFERRQPRRYGPDDAFYIKSKCARVVPVLLTRKEPQVRMESDENVVPNIVHYVFYGIRWEMTFLNYLSFLSVCKFIKPDHIFIHGNVVPSGPWWNRTLRNVPNIYHVYREQPMHIQGRKIEHVEDSSDIIRTQTLLDNGGIYLDSDVLVLKSFDPLRKYAATMGWENNGIVLAMPGSMFVCVWRGIWGQYHLDVGQDTKRAPFLLSDILPAHIHVEKDSLQTLDVRRKKYDWSQNYAMHVLKNKHPRPLPDGPRSINTLDTALGEVMRFVYYDSKELVKN